jgi:hypothetical protein
MSLADEEASYRLIVAETAAEEYRQHLPRSASPLYRGAVVQG